MAIGNLLFVRNSTIRPEPLSMVSVNRPSGLVAKQARRRPQEENQSACGAKPPVAPATDFRFCREETVAMDTSREYRQRAAICLQLANEANDVYVKAALAELAAEFRDMADAMEHPPRGGSRRAA
jgi:hypothetical protein